MKNNKGITLVALVITIIILLILAGISIAELTGNGLFENAKLAEEKSKEAQEKENSILDDYNNKIGQYLEGGRNISESELILNVKPRLDVIGATVLKIGADITAQNDSDVFGFMILVDGEVKEWFKLKEGNITVSNLEPNTEYTVEIIVVDKYGNIKKSGKEKYKTNNGLEYAVITSKGICNLKDRNNEYVFILEEEVSPYGETAIKREAFDNDSSTKIQGTINEKEYKYLDVDSSAIGTKIQATFENVTSSYVYGYVYAIKEDGTEQLLGTKYAGSITCTIPEGCKQIAIGMQRNCYLPEIKVVE